MGESIKFLLEDPILGLGLEEGALGKFTNK